MNTSLLLPEVQQFIDQNLKGDLPKLILKGSPFPKVSIAEIAEQIAAKRKAEKKLPTWFQTKNILFPKKINLEQSSSETTAGYKAHLVKGNTLIDLTGGFGVDSFYFSQKIKHVTYCETNPQLSELAEHNFQQLSGKQNVEFIHGNGIEPLQKSNKLYDWIYLDPSRRGKTGNRIFRLEDCKPNVIDYLPLLLEKGKNILLKTSPLLDLKRGVSSLKKVSEIHIVAVSGEVKELLWIVSSKNPTSETKLKTIHFNRGKTSRFDGNFDEEDQFKTEYSEPLKFLYEPNPAIMKSGLFNSLGHQFNLPKLHPNSHLYTSEKWVEFPGRVFNIAKTLPFKPKLFKKETGLKKANIAVRNFPKTVAQLKKELKINDGGTVYLFFTTNPKDEKIVILCKKRKDSDT